MCLSSNKPNKTSNMVKYVILLTKVWQIISNTLWVTCDLFVNKTKYMKQLFFSSYFVME